MIAWRITEEAGLGPVVAQHRQRDRIQFLGGDAGLDNSPHFFMCYGYDAPSFTHNLQFIS